MKVIKRNKDREPFNANKIVSAIFSAMKETKEGDLESSKKVASLVEQLVKGLKIPEIGIETIQSLVEIELMKEGFYRTAKAYVLYRDSRDHVRQLKSSLYDNLQNNISNVMAMKDIMNSNANVDEASFTGKNNKVMGEVLKEYALNNLIEADIAKAHREGEIYTHDLDNYATGMHNCLTIDFEELFSNNGGFSTRNGDVRRPNDIMTFFQLVAVVFQCQSQVQYGGVGANKIDYDGAPYVAITFRKAFRDALIDRYDYNIKQAETVVEDKQDIIRLGNTECESLYPEAFKIATRRTIEKTQQATESLFHNLNTLESRAGGQVPFTSINFGTDTSPEGRLIIRSLLNSSLSGIGKFHRTSIFPISIFKHMKGVNDVEGTPNYDLKLLAIESLSKRIYPNIANVDAPHLEEPNCPDEEFATMGCRTAIGKDRHGLGTKLGGRGNISPVTVNLVDIGIRYGICLGEREEADIEGFWNELDKKLEMSERALYNRFKWIASQKAKSGYFLYENGLMKNTLGRKLDSEEEVFECMKHNTLAIGYIGIAETMVALFGKTQTYDKDVWDFAYSVVERIYNFTKKASERKDLNYSCYATPAEGCCSTLRDILFKKYGSIKGVTDREYITNSHHIPVYDEIAIHEKIDKEVPFSKFATGGNICYVELDSSIENNPQAIQSIIDYAMGKGVTYLAINFPSDICLDCGYRGRLDGDCIVCGSSNVQRLRRVTGYLTTDYRKFNKGKIAETLERRKHSKYVKEI